MCIAVWIWQSHPTYELLLLLNRDEYHVRPTKAMGWWGKGMKILGGRDEVGGGTWLGCTREGRLAFLTNVREPSSCPHVEVKTRGQLPLRFLESNMSPSECASVIISEADQYDGFNLILVDINSRDMIYVSNRPKGSSTVQHVPPGIHVLANAHLDTPWPKATRLKNRFDDMLRMYGEEKISLALMVHELMEDETKADRALLPDTGWDPETEYHFSSIFVNINFLSGGQYGTRSISGIGVKVGGEVGFFERYLEDDTWKEHSVQYAIEMPNPNPQSVFKEEATRS